MTDTAQVINMVQNSQSAWGQVVAFLLAALLGGGGLAWVVIAIAKAKLEKTLADARTAALESQNRLYEAERKAEENKRLAETAVKGVETITKELTTAGKITPAEAKKTRNSVTAIAEEAGVAGLLETMVDSLGFAEAKKASRPEVQAPSEEDVK